MQSTPAFAAPAALSLPSTFAPRNALCSHSFRLPAVSRPLGRANISMLSEANIAAKAVKVAQVKELLDGSQMIFAVDAAGISVKDLSLLKRSLPGTSKVVTVKNTLMRRAIEGSKWETAGEFTKNSNMWFFVDEEVKETVEAYQKFLNDNKREDIKGGVFEGMMHDTAGITAIASLPSKKDLMCKIALSVKLVPTKLGRSVKAVPTKLARAIKLAVADEGEATPAAE